MGWVNGVAETEADDPQPTSMFYCLAALEAPVVLVNVLVGDAGVRFFVPTPNQVFD
jgi:hypothetical protein